MSSDAEEFFRPSRVGSKKVLTCPHCTSWGLRKLSQQLLSFAVEKLYVERGVSLIELLLVLAIVSLVAVGVSRLRISALQEMRHLLHFFDSAAQIARVERRDLRVVVEGQTIQVLGEEELIMIFRSSSVVEAVRFARPGFMLRADGSASPGRIVFSTGCQFVQALRGARRYVCE